MRFEFEKITVKHIQRRIAEEESRTKRRVTMVVLNPAEWFEFSREIVHYSDRGYLFHEIVIAPPVRPYHVTPNESLEAFDSEYRVVRIYREGFQPK